MALTIPMIRTNLSAAPLATTLLLVVMVGVASAVAKPAPFSNNDGVSVLPFDMNKQSSSSNPSATSEEYFYESSNETTEDYDYYYDEYDLDYSEYSPVPLNMSEFHLPDQNDIKAPHVPRYMLELYAHQDEQNHDSRRKSEEGLIRSFTATTTGSKNSLSEEEDLSASSNDNEESNSIRTHTLLFNVSLPRKEKVTTATLRLYALITRDQYTYIGVERRVKIVMEFHDNEEFSEELSDITVCQRDVYELQNSWETFDVTTAVKHWLAHPNQPQILQIHIESAFSTVGTGGDLDVATMPRSEIEPLLLVYSRSTPHQMAKREIKIMISHEYDDEKDTQYSQRRRKRRSTDQETSRSKRNIVEKLEEESNRIFEGDTLFPDLPTHAFTSLEGRRRPAGRKRRAKNSCKRKPLKVDFKDIGWDNWIIAPPSYEAYQCSGKCFYPLASHLSPTKHAVVQNLVHSLHPDRASRACCVPTKLGPISILYLENGTPTLEYSYNDMQVLECGCR